MFIVLPARTHTVLGAVGVHRDFDHRDFELLEGVREVIRITQPFKLASRHFKPEGTIVDLGRGVTIGGNELAVAAGPCSVESPEQINAVAESRREKWRQNHACWRV